MTNPLERNIRLDDEGFKVDVAAALTSIEQRGIRNEAQLTALNVTVSGHAERISKVESIIGTLKVIAGFLVAMVVAGVAAAVTLLKGD